MTQNYLQIDVIHQTIEPRSSENSEKDKCQKISDLGISYSNFRKSKIKKKY